jgi:GPH family glycoside/pentoside/hexuronide:cation symporter
VEGVPTRLKLAFGIGASGEAIQNVAFNTFAFLYFNQVLGLSGTLSGVITIIALAFDAVSDPLVGSISDRWRSRLGRRHPFMFAASLPAALCFYALFQPPTGLGQGGLFLWLTFFAVMLRLLMTLFAVPHLALGAELSTDYQQRTSVMSYNALFGFLGGAGFAFLVYTTIFRATPEYSRGLLNPDAYPQFALIGAVLVFAFIFQSAFFTRKVIPRLPRAPENLPPFRAQQVLTEMWQAWQNPNYRALLLGLLFLSATLGIRETLGLHMGTFFWDLSSEQIRLYIFAFLAGIIAAFLLAPALNRWLDKRATILVTLVGFAGIGTLPILLRLVGLFPENGSPWLLPSLLVFAMVSGTCGITLNITVMSTLADITDQHELTTHRRQEGIFYSARTFFAKATSGVGHLLAGIGLDLIAFPTNAQPGEVPPSAILGLGILEGPVAVLPAFIALYFYARYRLDRTSHAEIRAELDRRRDAPAVEQVAD